MPIGAQATSDETRAFMRDSNPLGFGPCLGTSKSVAFCHVGVVAESDYFDPAEHHPSPTTDTMNWTPTATREDVVRVVRRYVQLEFSIRSAAGRLAIDESRVAKDASIGVGPDCSDVELRAALRVYLMRNAIYAKPEAPVHMGTPEPGRKSRGPLRHVAPLRDVASIVRPKSSRGHGSPETSKRDWRASVGQKLGRTIRYLASIRFPPNSDGETRIPQAQLTLLIDVEQYRNERTLVRNQLQASRTAAGRMKSGGRNARNLRHHAEARVAELVSRDRLLTDRIQTGVKTRAYRKAIDHFLMICTVSPEVERDIFGEME